MSFLASVAGAIGSGAQWSAESGAASGLGGLANSWFSGLLSNYWNKKSSRDNAALSYEYAKALSDYNREQDFQYAQKYNDINMAMAKLYSENSAKWTVSGLRNAGLNPILAAGGSGIGSPQFGPSSPTLGSSSGSVNTFSSHRGVDIAEAARDFASLRLQSASAKQVAAQTDNVEAQTRTQELTTAKSAYDLLQDILRDGNRGGSWISHLFGEVTKGIKLSDKDSKRAADDVAVSVGRVLESSLKKATGLSVSASPNDSKSSSAPLPFGLGSSLDNVAVPKSKPAPFGWSRRTRTFKRRDNRVPDLMRPVFTPVVNPFRYK